MPGCVCIGLLVTLGRGETGTEFRSGAMLRVQVHDVRSACVGSTSSVIDCRKLSTPL